ncbi:MAG: outer membrane lipoprotein carrier protein LolA [Oleiphilus sp.]|nr:MAG: outer membrane lipoprotein carrier protein LolA [Oleiphilus sp.]
MSLRRLVTGLFVLILSASLFAESEKAAEAPVTQANESAELSEDLAELVKLLNGIRSISGAFVQYAVDKRGTTIQESRGSFKAKRPDYFFWHTEAPLEQMIYADGKQLTVYDPDLEQATVQPHNTQTEQSPAILFSGKTDVIARMYSVDQQVIDQATRQFTLHPRDKESLFETMRIRFSGSQLLEMRLRDSLGQESTISFVHTEVNSEIPDSAFEPALPAGTDVIEDLSYPRDSS